MTKRRKPSTNERTIAAVDRFSEAVSRGHDQAAIDAATSDLLETFADATQRQVTKTVAVLIERQVDFVKRLDKFEAQLKLLQRHIEAVDVRLDELDGSRTRAVGGE